MTKLVNRAKMTTATTGTGTITLGSAVAGYQTFADAGVVNGDVVRYVIEDGSNWEIGTGTYTASGTTLSRTPSESSNADAAISLSGNAVVYVTASAADILQPDNNLSDLTNASTARTNLGLGSIATQASNNVSITGGSITGITDLAVADGGTGVSTVPTNGQLLIGNGTGYTVAALTAGTGISVTNGAGSISIAATNNGTVTSVGSGTGLTGGPITSSGTLSVATNGITDTLLRDSAGLSVIGRSASATGDPADITAGTDHQVLRRSGTALGFGAIALNQSAAVTGTLPVGNGGTGATTLTGLLVGNGTSAFTAVTAPTGAVVGTTDSQTLTNKTLTDPAIVGTILEDVFTITDGAAFEIDPGNGSIQLITLGAARTPKATNFAAGEAITLMVDDGSAYTITWTDATFGGSGVVWKTDGGVAPTLNTTGYTVIVLWKVGTQVYGARVGDA